MGFIREFVASLMVVLLVVSLIVYAAASFPLLYAIVVMEYINNITNSGYMTILLMPGLICWLLIGTTLLMRKLELREPVPVPVKSKYRNNFRGGN